MTSTPSAVATMRLYFYGVIRGLGQEEPVFQAAPIGGGEGPVRAVRCLDMAAVVSDSPQERYDIGREHTIPHQLVLEEVMQRYELLPARFGIVAGGEEALRRKLSARVGEFRELFGYLAGRCELGLKVFWRRERLFAEVLQEDARILRIRDTLAQRRSEETHFERIHLGEMVATAMARKREAEAARVLAALEPLAVETKTNPLHSDLMVLTAAFLVQQQRVPEFDAAVDALADRQVERLLLKYVGPVPPYNFVSVTLD